jgi:hypothetical protein
VNPACFARIVCFLRLKAMLGDDARVQVHVPGSDMPSFERLINYYNLKDIKSCII